MNLNRREKEGHRKKERSATVNKPFWAETSTKIGGILKDIFKSNLYRLVI